MDIKCERCGTEYEFDDERVTEEGVTVKCSTCGHLFKVRKKSFVLTEPVPQDGADDTQAEKNWMVRRPDGSVLSFKELTTLQKWIVERRVSRDDEISKSGETWKRLGSIAELASFFQVVDQATGQIPAASAPVTLPPTAAVSGPTQDPAALSAPPAAAPAPSPAPQTGPVPVQAPPPAAAPPTGQVPAQPQPPPAAAAPPASQPEMPAVQPMSVPPSAQGEPDSWGDGRFDADEDDVVEKWKKRGRRKWFLIVPLILLAAGVGVFYLAAPEKFMELVDQVIGEPAPQIPELARTQFEQGRKHFLLDSDTELEAAVRDLTGAVSEAKDAFPEAMALLAEVHVTRAERADQRAAARKQALEKVEAELAALGPAEGKKPTPEAAEKAKALAERKAALTEELSGLGAAAKKDMDTAKQLIDKARKLDPEGFAPKRALANYLRVNGADRAQVAVPIKEASALAPDDPGLLYVDGAAYATDPASLDSAVQKLIKANELQEKANQPDMIRSRFALARALIALKRVDDAKVQLERILQKSPGHEPAKELLASLAPPEPEKPEEPEKPKEPAEPEQPDKPKQPAQPTTFDGWMTQADRLQRAGRTSPALRAYDAALEIKPGHVEALTGKGLCMLDMGNNAAAVAAFKRALKSNPHYGDAIIGLAEAYKYKRDKANAVKYYKRYLEVLPGGPEAAVARSNLEQLK